MKVINAQGLRAKGQHWRMPIDDECDVSLFWRGTPTKARIEALVEYLQFIANRYNDEPTVTEPTEDPEAS